MLSNEIALHLCIDKKCRIRVGVLAKQYGLTYRPKDFEFESSVNYY